MTLSTLDKIRKLLAKAEDPAASPQEAETYTAKAAELIAAHGIDAALLAARTPGIDRVADRTVTLQAPYAREKAQLLASVALALRCRAVLRRRTTIEGPQVHSLHLFGHEVDLERTDLLFTSLLLQATTRMARTPVPRGESAAAFRRSWLVGFESSVATRLQQAERRAEQRAERRTEDSAEQSGGEAPDDSVPSASLVLADRSAQVDAAMAEQYPALRRARPRTLSGSGMFDGYAAGARADLGGPRLGGGHRPLGRAG